MYFSRKSCFLIIQWKCRGVTHEQLPKMRRGKKTFTKCDTRDFHMNAKPRYLIFSVDTEPDNLWAGRRRGHVFTHDNIAAGIAGAAPLLKELGVKPVFFVSHSVAASAAPADILATATATFSCEIGSHFHPCDTPPFSRKDEVSTDNILKLSDAQLEEKFTNLHRSITARFGKISSFRAGAWTIDNRTVSLLMAHGYRCDSSITPGISWTSIGRGSHLLAPRRSYYLDERDVCTEGKSGVLEVPVSIRSDRRVPGFFPPPVSSLFTMPLASQKGFFISRVRQMKRFRPKWLRPAFTSLDEMKTIAVPLLEETGFLHVMVHSTELACGTSPYVSSEAERQRLLDRLRGIFTFALLQGCAPVTMAEYADLVSGRMGKPA
jgi:hypothetical protein